jgi:O-antigen ligase
MIIGTTGVIVLVWFALKQKFGSTKFVFYALFSALTFILMLLTGGRTAIGATLLGILALLARRLRRNAVILLATVIILAPIGLRIIVSFPGFEDVKYKLFSTTTTGRAELWTLAWDEIRQKPVIGWGTGSAYIKSVQAKGMTYHQTYLEFAVDHGIPFAVIMLVAFSWLPFRGILLMKRCQTEEMKDMVDLSSALLTGYLFSSFLGGVLNAATFVLPVYTAIALQEGIRAENREMEFYGLDEYDEGYLWADHSEEILSGGFLR